MKLGLVFGLLAVTGVVQAAPNEVMDLQAKVGEAEAKLEAVKERIEKARARYRAADAALQSGVRDLVRVGQFPDGFWLTRSVVMDSPNQAGLVAVMARQQSEKLVQAQAEAGQLAALYGEANRQLAALKSVQAAYGFANQRLVEAEKVVLRRAGIRADALSEDLQAALEGEFKAPKVRTAPVIEVGETGGLPVIGRVEKAFGRGEGAAKGGVVLKAAPGAEVHATHAAHVLYAGPFRHYGGLVIVKTVRGEDVLLGGMGTLNVNAGDDVGAGQQIGTVSDEGRIYWEVRKRGKLVDPL